MTELSCQICMDLMPLVYDGVASQESAAAVKHHIGNCPRCRAVFEGEGEMPRDTTNMMHRFQNQIRIFFAMVLMFGLFFGLMLTAGSGVFQNALIMPVIGGIGYYLFRWRGLYGIPALLFATHFVTNALGLGEEYLAFPELILWTGLYCQFALVGFAIAALLHFALKKEE